MTIETGLCGSCSWAERVATRRGSSFLKCGKAAHEPSLAKYPRLPVLHCAAYNGRVSDERHLVVTILGADRPGLVETLAEAIATHHGNWLESRLAHLAGKFAGVLRVSVATEHAEALLLALARLEGEGISVLAEPGHAVGVRFREVRMELVGADHTGIVRDVSTALARRRVNVEELDTGCFDAPMSGQRMFRAVARLQLPEEVSLDELRGDLEAVAHDVVVDVTLAEVD
jgi:glycine cleavage system regulatory protein